MKRYRVTALALSPVVIPNEGFISGSTFRGALVYQYLRTRGITDPNGDELFQRAFTRERLRVSPLYPGRAVLPLTAVSCKRYPGFRNGSAVGSHGVMDLLWAKFAGRRGPHNCLVCGQDLKGVRGFYTANTQEAPATTLETHVGIDRVSRTAAEGILYTLHILEPGQKLYGILDLYDDDLELFLAERVHCGAEKTRGRGLLQLTWEEEPLPSEAQQTAAWQRWSTELGKGIGENTADFYFSLTLESDAVIVDRFLRPSTDPADAVPWLPRSRPGETTSFGQGILKFVAGVNSYEVVKGWNSAHGLPREQEIATVRGSVFGYSFHGNDADRKALLHKLYTLELHGIGLRRGEGFGRVSVNSSFHSAFAEVK